jgi:heme exporter protein D
MLSNISDLFTMASLAICMLLSGIIFYYLRTRINMLEQSVMEQAQLLQQVLRHSQNQQQLQQQQQQQQQQQIATMATASTTVTAATATIVPKSLQQQQQRLIPVSDDSDSDDSESDDSDSDDSDDESESDNDGVNLHRSKSIDLSALTSTAQIPLMTSTFFENGSSNTEIKVIELKHYFNGNNDGTGDNSDSGSDSGSDNSSDSGSDNSSDNSSDGNESGSDDGNDKGNGSSNNNESKNVDKKKQKHFEKIKKGAHPSLDVPVPLKSMPVNMLRDLAKTKLTHLEQPAINKMSKKEILKALDN